MSDNPAVDDTAANAVTDAVVDDGVEPLASDAAPPDEPMSELDATRRERDEWQDRAQRIAAEFDNYRKRAAQQQVDAVDRATGKLAESLLSVLDAAEAAFVQHPAEVEPLFNLLLVELRKQGLESMNLFGQVFDPNLADAVLHEPADDHSGDPVVSEVLRSGYTWKGKVLRAAMVKVRG